MEAAFCPGAAFAFWALRRRFACSRSALIAVKATRLACLLRRRDIAASALRVELVADRLKHRDGAADELPIFERLRGA
jgi:hypothetical protein